MRIRSGEHLLVKDGFLRVSEESDGMYRFFVSLGTSPSDTQYFSFSENDSETVLFA